LGVVRPQHRRKKRLTSQAVEIRVPSTINSARDGKEATRLKLPRSQAAGQEVRLMDEETQIYQRGDTHAFAAHPSE
jgi:hypothetical protein